MQYKKIFWSTIILIVCILSSIFCATIMVDPLGIVKAPTIKGFNNYKVEQGYYLDMWKTYQFKDMSTKVVYIGTSRVLLGFRNHEVGYKDNEVYNLAFNSLSLAEMENYLKFAYKVHKIEKVYIGLDFFQFDKNSFYSLESNFPHDRLEKIINNKQEFIQLSDTFHLYNKVIKTVRESRKSPDKVSEYCNGWLIEKENASTNLNAYYGVLNQYITRYRRWQYEPKTMECLQRIVAEAKKNNVEVHVFFNPINIDLQALIYATGHRDDLFYVKSQVADIVGTLYDFNLANSYTENRKLYHEGSHYLSKFGDMMKADMHTKKDTERMLIITPENKEVQLAKEIMYMQQWKEANQEYYNTLQKKVKLIEQNKLKKIKKGDFKDYIGF